MLHMIKHTQSHKIQNNYCYMLLHSQYIPAYSMLHSQYNYHNSLLHNLNNTDLHRNLRNRIYTIEGLNPLLSK